MGYYSTVEFAFFKPGIVGLGSIISHNERELIQFIRVDGLAFHNDDELVQQFGTWQLETGRQLGR